MAGNLVSIMAISSQGRGGRQPEILPKSNKTYTVQEKQNARFRCSACNTILQRVSLHSQECPFCHSRNSIVTITGREIKERLPREDLLRNLKRKIRNSPNIFSKKDLAEEFNVSYTTIYSLCKLLSISDLRLLRKRKRRRLIVQNTPAHEIDVKASMDAEKFPQNKDICNASDDANTDVNISPFFDTDTYEKALVAFELKKEGYAATEIARLLSVSIATVYWYIRKIK